MLVLVLAFALGFLMCTGTPHIRRTIITNSDIIKALIGVPVYDNSGDGREAWHIEFNRVLALTTAWRRGQMFPYVLKEIHTTKRIDICWGIVYSSLIIQI